MKRFRLLVALPLAVAMVVAIPATALAGAGKSHDVKAEVVAVDNEAKTITIKDEKGENHTAPLLGKAVDEAKALKAGDKVTVTCKDKDDGAHEGVSSIKKITA
jgi:predicted small secreted protein